MTSFTFSNVATFLLVVVGTAVIIISPYWIKQGPLSKHAVFLAAYVAPKIGILLMLSHMCELTLPCELMPSRTSTDFWLFELIEV